MSAAEDLRTAAEVLERDGWARGAYHSRAGCHCVLGAVATAITGTRSNPERWQYNSDKKELWERFITARDHLTAVITVPNAMFHVGFWNDKVAEDKGQVIEALRAAARKAEVEEKE